MRQSVLQRSDLYDLSFTSGLLLSSVPSCENPSGHPGSSTYLFSDPEGVRLTFNSSGTITAYASYDAYGNVISGGLSSVTPFGYAGGYTDPTGLIYLVNRYYDPSTGQFLSVDPLVGVTDQPYQYVGGDPVNFTDPTGLACWAALELGFTQASRQCWKSGYKRAGHDIARKTIALCVSGSAAFGPGVQGSLCIGHSGSQWFVAESGGGGGGSPNLSVSIGIMYSNADMPKQLAGPFAQAGGAGYPVEDGPSVGAEGAYGTGQCTAGIWEFSPTVGLGLLLRYVPYEAHGGVTNTWVQDF